MIKEKCKKYDICNAPICPLDDLSIKFGIWYPDEEICVNIKYFKILWVKNQKKIKKKCKDNYSFFNVDMIDRNIVVKTGIIGLNPDKLIPGLKANIKNWIKKHPTKKPMSEEKRKELSDRFKKDIRREEE